MIGPQIKITGDKFTSVIDTNDGRVSNLAACAFHGLDNVFPLVAEPCIDNRREAGEGIDDRQDPDLAAGGQLVMHKIHRPDMVGTGGCSPVRTQLCLHPPLGHLVAQLKVHLLVKAIDSLLIDRPSIPLEQDMYAAVSIPDARLANIPDPQLQFSVLAAFRLVYME